MSDPKEYGKALFLLSEERGTSEVTLSDLAAVEEALAAFPRYGRLLDSPALPMTEKRELIRTAFSVLQTDTVSFLCILAERHAVFCFPKCAAAYRALYDEVRGIERVVAVTAVPMTDEQKARLTEKLSRMTKKTVILKNETDPSLLGGIRLRCAGIQLDSSLRARLNALEKRLAALIVG